MAKENIIKCAKCGKEIEVQEEDILEDGEEVIEYYCESCGGGLIVAFLDSRDRDLFSRGGDRIMKRLKGLDEIHEIMEKIHEDEKGLTLEQTIKKLREESEQFLLERNLKLKRVMPKESRHVSV